MIGCAAGHYCSVVTCSDATLHCFAVGDGSRLMPAIKLQGPAVHLRVQDNFVSVVTAHGQINVWDIVKKKSMLKTSILNLTDPGWLLQFLKNESFRLTYQRLVEFFHRWIGYSNFMLHKRNWTSCSKFF